MIIPSLIRNTINASNSEFNVKKSLKICPITPHSPHIQHGLHHLSVQARVYHGVFQGCGFVCCLFPDRFWYHWFLPCFGLFCQRLVAGVPILMHLQIGSVLECCCLGRKRTGIPVFRGVQWSELFDLRLGNFINLNQLHR